MREALRSPAERLVGIDPRPGEQLLPDLLHVIVSPLRELPRQAFLILRLIVSQLPLELIICADRLPLLRFGLTAGNAWDASSTPRCRVGGSFAS